MKNIYKFLLFFITTFAFYPIFSQNNWTQKTDFPGGARNGAVGMSIDNRGYIGTGNSADSTYNDWWEYYPYSNNWIQKASLPGSIRSMATGTSLNGKAYVGLGYSGGGLSDWWEYDPVSDTWMQKTDFPGGARCGAIAFAINGKIYVGFGIDNSYSNKNDLWEFDPVNNSWLQKANCPGSARAGASAFTINNKAYVGLGGGTSKLKDLWEYNPTTNNWTQKADFAGTARNFSVSFSVGNYGYFGTGSDAVSGNSYTNDFWKYDPTNNSWTQITSLLGEARLGAVGFSIGPFAYIVTGQNSGGSTISDLWQMSENGTFYIGVISGGPYYPGSQIDVPFSTSLAFNSGNIFTAQLSDASGSFTNPSNIGSIVSTISDTIIAGLPYNLDVGSSYRIRVISSNPADTSTDNMLNINVASLPNALMMNFISPELKQCIKDHVGLDSISDITYQICDTITFLDCYGRKIIDISDLLYLSNLDSLDLSGNKISDISPLASLPKLKYVNISDNYIQEIYPLAFADINVMKVNLGNNFITDFSFLKQNSNCYFDIVGEEIQDAVFDTSKVFLNYLDAYVYDASGIMEIKYDVFISSGDSATLYFGDDTFCKVQSDGITHSVLHNYPNCGLYIVKLEYNNKQLLDTIAKPFFVNKYATGNNTGVSWQNAYIDLAPLLDSVSDAIEIWVAKGTYYPTNLNLKDRYFNLHDGVYLYGGFNGTERFRRERNWSLNPTVLSGDIGIPNDISDNSYHVVSTGFEVEGSKDEESEDYFSSTLDGFVITGGNAIDTIYGVNGAGIYNGKLLSIQINNCIIKNNYAKGNGGGMYSYSTYFCQNSVFIDNVAQLDGGGIFSVMPDWPTGGSSGGGSTTKQFFESASQMTGVFNTKFINNSSIEGRGGACYSEAKDTIVNCLFASNKALMDSGGAIFFTDTIFIVNSTFADNICNFNYGNSISTTPFFSETIKYIYNSIFWNNNSLPTLHHLDLENQTNLSHCILQNATLPIGPDIWSNDPLFVNPYGTDSILGTIDDNYSILPCSPAIDKGESATNHTKDDLSYGSRIIGAEIDLGAYEIESIAIDDVNLHLSNDTLFAEIIYLNQNDQTLGNTITWYLNNVPITNTNDPFLVVTQSGDYFIVVADTLGCYNDTSNTISFSINRPYTIEDFALKVYPNPSNGQITLEYTCSQNSSLKIKMINIIGIEVFNYELKCNVGTTSKTFDMSNLSTGVYYLIAISKDNVYTRNIVIRK
jgi:N-acetylneuraminic acid mutarotase